jgi:threonine/homoserine/homoserine lactone efflux protein
MDPSVLAAAALGGAVVVLTPGPAVLALIAIGAAQHRRAAAGFIFGHLLGDLWWTVLALAAMVGAQTLAPRLFQGLALACAAYLLWLGIRALRARPDASGRRVPLAAARSQTGWSSGSPTQEPSGHPVGSPHCWPTRCSR